MPGLVKEIKYYFAEYKKDSYRVFIEVYDDQRDIL